MVDRYPGQRSEYGGGDGVPQRLPDGSSLDLPGISDKAGARARLMRAAGIRDYDPGRVDAVGAANTALSVGAMSAAQREAYEKDLELSNRRAEERAEMVQRTNGYSEEPDQYVGESGEGNSVDPFN